MRFKTGDRVRRIIDDNGLVIQVGMTGTVTKIDVFVEGVPCVYVNWDAIKSDPNSWGNLEDRLEFEDALTKPSNPKDRAATSRLDVSLFPQSAVIYGALAMTEGDCKYGGYNYRTTGVNVSVYVAALLRHVYKAYNGEWADPVTKVPHFANAIACLAIMIDGYEQGNLKDDRPPVQDTAGLLKRSEEIVTHLQTLFPDGPERFTQRSVNGCVLDR